VFVKVYHTFLVLLVFSLVNAQNQFIQFQNYSTTEGLSVGVVYDFVEDNTGYLWVATQDGLNRFDGYSFKVFRSDGSDSTIVDNNIFRLEKDESGNIWAGSERYGLSVVNTQTNKITNYIHSKDDKTSLSSNRIRKIRSDFFGNIWVATNKGINKFISKDKTFKTYLNKEYVSDIFVDSEGTLWIGTFSGLFSYNPTLDKFVKVKPEKKFRMLGRVVLSITEDINKNLWIASNNDINIYNKKKNTFHNLRNREGYFKKFPRIQTVNMMTDRNGNIWITTSLFNSPGHGLYFFNSTTEEFTLYKHSKIENNTLSGNDTRVVYETKNGLIYSGSFGGGFSKIRYSQSEHFKSFSYKPNSEQSIPDPENIFTLFTTSDDNVIFGSAREGFSIYDKNKNKFTSFRKENSALKTNLGFSAFFRDSYGKTWIGSDKGLYSFDEKTYQIKEEKELEKKLENKNISSIFEDSKKNLWISTTVALYRYNPTTKEIITLKNDPKNPTTIADPVLHTIVEDDYGYIWGATFLNGVERINISTLQASHYKSDPKNPNSLTNNSINSLARDKTGNIWIGSNRGLNKLNPKSGVLKKYTINNGLVNDQIYSIIEDDANNIWFTTSNGLTRLNYLTDNIKFFTREDGLPGNEHNSGAYAKDRDGNLYFSGPLGAYYFHPNRLITNKNQAHVAINKIEVNYKELKTDTVSNFLKKLYLNYDQNTLAFDISGLDFTNPKKNKYKYVLEGMHEKWINAGTNRFINYTNLPSGNYTLRIKASNNDGVWTTEDKSLAIFIKPHFSETWWFRTIITLLIALAVFLFYLSKMKSAQRQREILEKTVDERTKELQEKNQEVALANDNLAKENDIRRQTEAALLAANKESEAILRNVKEGLFLLNEDNIISEQHSEQLEIIFENTELSEVSFLSEMKQLLTNKNYEALLDFVDLLFNPDVDEEVVNDLNPLDQVEVHFENEKGNYSTKHLVFTFRRIIANEKILNLLVTVRDETERIILETKLKEAEKKNKAEMEQLMSILKADPKSITQFLNTVEQDLKEISRRMKTHEGSDYEKLLDWVFRNVHNLKGNSGLLNLKFFTEKFHVMEEILTDLKEMDDLTGDDFLKLLFEVNEVNKDVKSMRSLINKVAAMSKQIQGAISGTEEPNHETLIKSFHSTVKRISDEVGKKAKLSLLGFDENTQIPSRYSTAFKDIVIQLIRNSLIHGIEKPEERRSVNKASAGKLYVKVDTSNNKFAFKFRDDGSGLNIEKIKKKALKTGKYTEEQLFKMTNSQIARLIFSDGFSTASEASEHAGRGQGMNIIKEIVGKHKGKLKFSYGAGKFFELGVEFPS
jgi:ligand-binding sensor domain-containing protein/PAS domain-containing protein